MINNAPVDNNLGPAKKQWQKPELIILPKASIQKGGFTPAESAGGGTFSGGAIPAASYIS
jgi:hypothetical protein